MNSVMVILCVGSVLSRVLISCLAVQKMIFIKHHGIKDPVIQYTVLM